MAEVLSELIDQALADVGASHTLPDLDEVRVRLLGKKGLLTEQLKGLGKLPAQERPAAGQRINQAKSRHSSGDSRHDASCSIANHSMRSSRGARSMCRCPGGGRRRAASIR